MIKDRNYIYFFPKTLAIWLVLLVLVFSACHDDAVKDDPIKPDPMPVPEASILIYTGSDDEQMRHEVAEFALEQFNVAQQGLSHHVNYSFRYVDVNEDKFDAAASNYLLSGKYPYIIGPDDRYSNKVTRLINTAANCFKDPKKAPAILLPCITSVEEVRRAQTIPYLRILTTDGRGMLHAALKAVSISTMSPYVFLLCSDEDSEKSYCRFFSTYAPEMGFNWVGEPNWRGTNGLINVKADISRNDLEAKIDSAYKDFCEQVKVKDDSCQFFNFIVTTENPEHGLLLDSLREAKAQKDSRFNQTEIMLLNRQNAVKQAGRYHDVTAMSFSASPKQEAFAKEFQRRFGRYPIQGEAHFYDAVLMSLYAEFIRQMDNESLVEGDKERYGHQALDIILAGNEEVGASWDSQGIRKALEGYLNDKHVKLTGASSDWTFTDEDNFSCAHGTYYGLEYLGELGSNDIISPGAWASSDITDEVWYGNEDDTSWNPKAVSIEKAIADPNRDIPELKDRWALLVAGTQAIEKGEWGVNYRHQADVWNMYQLLRNHGYADNHIIVVTEDDIFGAQIYGESANEKVVKRTHEPDAINLYEDIPSHYRLTDLTQQDIMDIIAGKKSEHLPYVIEATENDNVFIYWSGHGNSTGNMRWGGKDSEALTEFSHEFSYYHMREALRALYDLSKDTFSYRRLLMVVEACHSGKFITSLPAAKGMLYIAAAEGEEYSWADNNNLIIIPGHSTIHRFDRFSASLVSIIEKEPEISLGRLYELLYNQTTDSHPMIYNNVNYGPLQSLYFTDFRL